LVTGRYSSLVADQLTAHVANRSANIFQIIAEIAALEGASTAKSSCTKPSREYRGKLLNGLWHKHYPQARFITANLLLHWKRCDLLELIKSSYARREFFDEQAAKDLVYRFVCEGYAERSSSGKLTGEWIVFAEQGGKKYYLSLASHSEDDSAIWSRCKACAAEFPELEIIQADL
jgi:hypothetical protein